MVETTLGEETRCSSGTDLGTVWHVYRPLRAALRAELTGRLTAHEETREAHAGRERTEGDLTASATDVPEHARATAAVVEVDRAESLCRLGRESAEHDADVVL